MSIRWFFALMAIAVSLGLVAWQHRIVRDRQSMRQCIELRGGAVPDYHAGLAINRSAEGIPFWREWMGDEAAPVVLLPQRLRPAEISSIQHRFPEAEIIVAK